ncbi:hypothetical protein FB451DRAFT_1169294 [Mycena latifolia]|nr:hypothetical protein FB451DRAFT_1169294 [Mycena latifolia]
MAGRRVFQTRRINRSDHHRPLLILSYLQPRRSRGPALRGAAPPVVPSRPSFRRPSAHRTVPLPSRQEKFLGPDGTGRLPVVGTRRTGATGTAHSPSSTARAPEWTPQCPRVRRLLCNGRRVEVMPQRLPPTCARARRGGGSFGQHNWSPDSRVRRHGCRKRTIRTMSVRGEEESVPAARGHESSPFADDSDNCEKIAGVDGDEDERSAWKVLSSARRGGERRSKAWDGRPSCPRAAWTGHRRHRHGRTIRRATTRSAEIGGEGSARHRQRASEERRNRTQERGWSVAGMTQGKWGSGSVGARDDKRIVRGPPSVPPRLHPIRARPAVKRRLRAG